MLLLLIILLALVTAAVLGRAETKHRDQRRNNAKKGTR